MDIKSPYILPSLDANDCNADQRGRNTISINLFGLSQDQEYNCALCMRHLINLTNGDIEVVLRQCSESVDVALLLSTAGILTQDLQHEMVRIKRVLETTVVTSSTDSSEGVGDEEEMDRLITYLIVSPHTENSTGNASAGLLRFFFVYVTYLTILILTNLEGAKRFIPSRPFMLKILSFITELEIPQEQELQKASALFVLFVLNRSILDKNEGIREIANILVLLLLEGLNSPEVMGSKRKAASIYPDSGNKRAPVTVKQASDLLQTMKISNVRVLRQLFQILSRYYRMDREILKLMISNGVVSGENELQELFEVKTEGSEDPMSTYNSVALSVQQRILNKTVFSYIFFNPLNRSISTDKSGKEDDSKIDMDEDGDSAYDSTTILPELILVRVEDCVAIQQVLDSPRLGRAGQGRMGATQIVSQSQTVKIRDQNEAYLDELCEFILDIRCSIGDDSYYPLLSPPSCDVRRKMEIQRLIVDFINKTVAIKTKGAIEEVLRYEEEKSICLTSLHKYLHSTEDGNRVSMNNEKDDSTDKREEVELSFPSLPVREIMEHMLATGFETKSGDSLGSGDALFSRISFNEHPMVDGMYCTNTDEVLSILSYAVDIVQTSSTTVLEDSPLIRSVSDILHIVERFENELQVLYSKLLVMETRTRYSFIPSFASSIKVQELNSFLLSLLSAPLLFVATINIPSSRNKTDNKHISRTSKHLLSIIKKERDVLILLRPLIFGMKNNTNNNENILYSSITKIETCLSQLITTPVTLQTRRTGIEGVRYNVNIVSFFVQLCLDKLENNGSREKEEEEEEERVLDCGDILFSGEGNSPVFRLYDYKQHSWDVLETRLVLQGTPNDLGDGNKANDSSLQSISSLLSGSCPLIPLFDELDGYHKSRVVSEFPVSLLVSLSLELLNQLSTIQGCGSSYRIGRDALRSFLSDRTAAKQLGTFNSTYSTPQMTSDVRNIISNLHKLYKMLSIVLSQNKSGKNEKQTSNNKNILDLVTISSLLCLVISTSPEQGNIEEVKEILDLLKNGDGKDLGKEEDRDAIVVSTVTKETPTIEDVRGLGKACLLLSLEIGGLFTKKGYKGLLHTFTQELLRRISNIRRRRREETFTQSPIVEAASMAPNMRGESNNNNDTPMMYPRNHLVHSPQPIVQRTSTSTTPQALPPETNIDDSQQSLSTISSRLQKTSLPDSVDRDEKKKSIPQPQKQREQKETVSADALTPMCIEYVQTLPINLGSSALGSPSLDTSSKTRGWGEKNEIGIQTICAIISRTFITPPSCIVWNLCRRVISEEGKQKRLLGNEDDRDSFSEPEEIFNSTIPPHVVSALLPKPVQGSIIPYTYTEQTSFVGSPESVTLGLASLRPVLLRLQAEDEDEETFARIYSGFCLSLSPIMYSVNGNKGVINNLMDLVQDVVDTLVKVSGDGKSQRKRIAYRLLHSLISSLTNMRCSCDDIPGVRSMGMTKTLRSRLDSILLSVLNADSDNEMSFSATADLSGVLRPSLRQHALRWITTAINEGLSPIREEDIKKAAMHPTETNEGSAGLDISEEDRKYSVSFIIEKSSTDGNGNNTSLSHYSLNACSGAVDLLDVLFDTDEGDGDILSSISDVLMRILVAYNAPEKDGRNQNPMENLVRDAKKLSKKISESMNKSHSKISLSDISKTPQRPQSHHGSLSSSSNTRLTKRKDLESASMGVDEPEEEKEDMMTRSPKGSTSQPLASLLKSPTLSTSLPFSTRISQKPQKKEKKSDCILSFLESSFLLHSDMFNEASINTYSESVTASIKDVIGYLQSLNRKGKDIDTRCYVLPNSVTIPLSILLARTAARMFNICSKCATGSSAMKAAKYSLLLCLTILDISHPPVESNEYVALLLQAILRFKDFDKDSSISKVLSAVVYAMTVQDMMVPFGQQGQQGKTLSKKVEKSLPQKYSILVIPISIQPSPPIPVGCSRIVAIVWLLYAMTCSIIGELHKQGILRGTVNTNYIDITSTQSFAVSECIAGAAQRYLVSDLTQGGDFSGGYVKQMSEWQELREKLRLLAEDRKETLLNILAFPAAANTSSLSAVSQIQAQIQSHSLDIVSAAKKIPRNVLVGEAALLMENQNWVSMMSKLCELEDIESDLLNAASGGNSGGNGGGVFKDISTTISTTFSRDAMSKKGEKTCVLHLLTEINRSLVAFQTSLHSALFVHGGRPESVSSLSDKVVLREASATNSSPAITVATLKCNFRHVKKLCSIIASQFRSDLLFLLASPSILSPSYPPGCVSLVLRLLKCLGQDPAPSRDVAAALGAVQGRG